MFVSCPVWYHPVAVGFSMAIIVFIMIVGAYYLIRHIKGKCDLNAMIKLLCDSCKTIEHPSANNPVRISPVGVECDYSRPCKECKNLPDCLAIPNSFPSKQANWNLKENDRRR